MLKCIYDIKVKHDGMKMKRRKGQSYNFASGYPELAAQFHPIKNGDLKPGDFTSGSNKKVWWLMPYDDPETGKHFNFEWQATIADRVKGSKAPYLTGNAVYPGYNDLATKAQELAKEWHPTKNDTLKPTDVTCNSHKMVWWWQPYDDPDTGLHFDFEWQATPNSRMNGNGCPYLGNNGVWAGYNDLESRYPEIAAQWHPTKNGNVKPCEVSYSSNKKYWWMYSYDDAVLGHFDFEWEATVNNRTFLGEGCPYVGNDKLWVGYNDLQTRFPDVAAQWHPTKNGKLTPQDVVFGTPRQVWWLQKYTDPTTGKYFEFEWKAPVNIRTGVGTNDGHQTGCPYFPPSSKLWRGYNDLETCYPEIAVQWHPSKNGKLTPSDVVFGTPQSVWWRMPYTDAVTGKHFEFEWKAPIASRTGSSDGHQTACPYLPPNSQVWKGYNDLESCYPKIATEWHPIKNRKRTPDGTYKAALRKVWWKCGCCGHEWYASVKGRTIDKSGCPACRKANTNSFYI